MFSDGIYIEINRKRIKNYKNKNKNYNPPISKM